MYKIRPAEPGDLENLQQLNTLVFKDNAKWDADAIENWAHTPQGETYLKKAIVRKNGCFYVCEENGSLIGYADGLDMQVDWRKSKYFTLINMGVLPNRTNEGIGKALLNEVISWAKKHGFERIYLNCYIKNTNAVEFYKHLGFEEIDVCLEKEI